MLTLRTMVAGDTAGGPGGLPRAATVAAQWNHDANSLQIRRYSANFLYRLAISGEPHYLRVAPASERTPERLALEVALLRWLHTQGWQVPVAVPTREGHHVAMAIAGGETYHGVMWSEVPGDIRESTALSMADLETWGALLGRLHTTLQQAPPAARPDRTAWHFERDLLLAALPDWPREVQAAARGSLDWIATLPMHGDTYGLIHGDVELDNLPWGTSGPGVIDFDEAGLSWLAADIAFAVRDLVEEGGTSSPRLAAFLAGYASARPLPQRLPQDLPRFSQWARLVTLARITHARASDATQFPDWARALDHRLGELAGSYQASILQAARADLVE